MAHSEVKMADSELPRSVDEPVAAIFSFNNSALQSWIPASVFGVLLRFGGVGVILFFGGVQLWYLSVTLSVFGATLLLRASKETYTFDLASKTFFMVKKRLFRTKVVELNFREIKDVKLDESVDSQGIYSARPIPAYLMRGQITDMRCFSQVGQKPIYICSSGRASVSIYCQII
jgi:hypothetical protein